MVKKALTEIHGARNDENYQEFTINDLRQQVYIKPLSKIPTKLKLQTLRPKDKRKKPVDIVRIPLGAAGEEKQIPANNLVEVTDHYSKDIREKLTDCAHTDPTATPGIKKRVKSLFSNSYTLELQLKSSRDDSGNLLSDQEKENLLKQFEQTYNQYVKLLDDWDELPLISTLKKIKKARHASLVQGNALIKIFPPISQLSRMPGDQTRPQLPLSLKFVPSEDIGSVIVDKQTHQIVGIHINTFDSSTIVLPDEMIYIVTNDSGLVKSEMFYGRSEIEPYVQLCRINKQVVNYHYAKAVSSAYMPKVVTEVPVDGTPEEKDNQLKKRATDLASEGTDVIAVESHPEAKTTVYGFQTNDEMIKNIREDIDMLLISGVGTTNLQLGRTGKINRATATVIEIENIRNVRAPDELEFAEAFESQLYNRLLAHLAGVPLEKLPVRIVMKRIEPTDEASGLQDKDETVDENIENTGEDMADGSLVNDDSGPLGAAKRIKLKHKPA